MRLRPKIAAPAPIPALRASPAPVAAAAPAPEKPPGAPAASAGHFRKGRQMFQRAMARAAKGAPHQGHRAASETPLSDAPSIPDALAFTREDFDPDLALGPRENYIERDLTRQAVAPTKPTPIGEPTGALSSGPDTPIAEETILEPGSPVSTSPERSNAGSTISSDDRAPASTLCGVLPAKPKGINSLPSAGKINTVNAASPGKPLTLQDMAPEQTQAIASHLGLPLGAGQAAIAQELNRTMDAWRCLGFDATNNQTSPHGFPHTQEYRHYDFGLGMNAQIDQKLKGFDDEAVATLREALKNRTVHLVVNESTTPASWALLFMGISTIDDLKNVRNNAFGGKGTLTDTLDRIADIFAHIEKSGKGRINLISGHSMGGASAQYFAARLATITGQAQSRGPMVLLDPQLLNNRHAAHAVRDAEKAFPFDSPRGIAITLNSPAHPKKSLMGKMKSYAGYRHPGLLELKLPTLPNDVAQVVTRVDKNNKVVKQRVHSDPRPVMGMGYHLDPQKSHSIYEAAIHRWMGSAAVDAAPSNAAVV
jgi:hypothetical protein